MRRFPLLLFIGLVTACGGTSPDDPSSEWLHVLKHKKAAAGPAATAREKQVYADTLGAFVQRHPQHSRAREVYQRIQLDFAGGLASAGRHQDAIRFYRAVLEAAPRHAAAP